jgi:integrase
MQKTCSHAIVKKPNRTTGELELWVRFFYYDAIGKHKEKMRRAENATQAKQIIKDLEREFDTGGARALDADKLKFRQLAEQYKEKRLIAPIYDDPDSDNRRKVAGLKSWKDARRNLEVLVEHFGELPIKKIEYEHLLDFKVKRLEQPKMRGGKIIGRRKLSSIHRELEILRACLNYAIGKRYMMFNPFDGGATLISKADEAKRDVVIDYAQEQKLLDACVGSRYLERLKPALICLIETGMRSGEVRHLERRDVDLERRLITVRVKNSKTQTKRLVPVTQRLLDVLADVVAKLPDNPTELVFGVKVSWKKSFAQAKKLAGLDGDINDDCTLRIHDLRHVGTTRIIESGANPKIAMKITGHTQEITFRRYLSVTDVSLQSVAEGLAEYRARMEALQLEDAKAQATTTELIQ